MVLFRCDILTLTLSVRAHYAQILCDIRFKQPVQKKGEHLQLMISCGKHPEPSWWFQSASGCRMTHFRISLRSLICCTIFGPVTFLQNTTFDMSFNVWQQGVVMSKQNVTKRYKPKVRSICDYSSC